MIRAESGERRITFQAVLFLRVLIFVSSGFGR
jgi:hypothetical protein